MLSTRTSRVILVAGGTVLILVAVVSGALIAAARDGDDASPATEDAEDDPLLVPEDQAVGEPVPTSPFETLDGATASLADYAGRPLVLNFFGSWCAPCIAEMPAIEQVHQEMGDRIGFLGLAVQDTVEDAREIVARTGVTYDVGRDLRSAISTELQIVRMPSTVFVSRDGEVLEVHGGELTADELRARIRELLA